MILLGIDGGQTATKVCLLDDESGCVVVEHGPQVDHMTTEHGQALSKRSIQEPLRSAVERMGRPSAVDAAVISLSGVYDEHKEFIRGWIHECIPVHRLRIEGDAAANLAGAYAGKNDGVLVIAGGGSFACFRGRNSEYCAGGFGHILGTKAAPTG